MSIRRQARFLVLVGGIIILLVRVQAQVRPQDEHPGEDKQFFMQIDKANIQAHSSLPWTSTRHLTLNYNLSNEHASWPDNGMYHAVRFYHSTQPKNWIEFPSYPTPDEWQSTPFYLDGVNEPGRYVVTGDFKWSQGIDHYKCHVNYDPIKPYFLLSVEMEDDTPIAPLTPGMVGTVYFKFTDNMADWCLVNGAVRRADTNEVVGGFSKDSAGKLMRCGVVNSATLVPLIGQGFAAGKYYVVIYIWDLAGNMATSDRKSFSINPVKPKKPAKPVKH